MSLFKFYFLKKICFLFGREDGILKDNNGHIFTGLAIFLVFSFAITSILLLNFVVESNEINSISESSAKFNYVVEDYNKNIAISGREVIDNIANKTISNCMPCYNSGEEIKKELQDVLDSKSDTYIKSSGVVFESTVLSVSCGDDPYHINIKTLVKGVKGKLQYNHVVESKVSIEGCMDTLPFLMCRDSTLTISGGRIYYNDGLSYYLSENGLLNPEVYENASTPLFIKKCPYDPYEHHGEGQCMKNCVDNGYFHESADGSCYLCRLEGKGGCLHYGLEVFVVPRIVANPNLSSISAPDHVMYQDHYPGNGTIIYENNGSYEILILDDSHKAKYGMG